MHEQEVYEFDRFRLEPSEGVLRHDGREPVSLPPKAFDLLTVLVRRAGRLVTKDELLKEVWPDTFVEEANLSYNVSIIRKALGADESGEQYIETVPRRGYRFVARVKIAGRREEGSTTGAVDVPVSAVSNLQHPTVVERHWRAVAVAVAAFIIVSSAIGWRFRSPQTSHPRSLPRSLDRLTFDSGLQSEPTWSPDGRMIAYSSDHGGNFDIWVQQRTSTPVPVTSNPAHDWQPDWSPDGSQIVFRSERNGGGLYVVPALGGAETKIASFGYRPRWSPNGSQILFATSALQYVGDAPRLYVVGVDGRSPFEVQHEFLAGMKYGRMGGYAWHPDGKRISVWGEHKERGRGFWTMPLVGGTLTTSEIEPEVKLQGAVTLQKFVWAPSGQYLYFEGVSQGVRNLWRVTVEPKTLKWVAGPDRLTVGAGEDTDIAISADGKKLALATRLERTRVWSLPFDPISGQLKGEARPVTRDGIDAWWFDVTRDGSQLVFITRRADKTELNVSRDIPKSQVWKQSLTDGRETLLAQADEYFRIYPRLSPDGTRLTYQRLRASGQQEETAVLATLDGGEETPLGDRFGPTDWSADGQWLLGNCRPSAQGRFETCLAPLSAAPHVERRMSVVATHPDLNLFVARFSPDQRWIAIQGVKYGGVSTIYAMPAAGGAITQITEGTHWDDKPCWGPDGRTIYFVSDRGGFLNVWGLRFDPANGTRVSEPFRVTTFESPRQMVFPRLAPLQLRVTADRLFLNLTELSGSIWILDNVDR